MGRPEDFEAEEIQEQPAASSIHQSKIQKQEYTYTRKEKQGIIPRYQ